MEGLLVLALYVFIGIVVVALGVLLYLRSAASRRRYSCPQCGEEQTVELMKASRCSACGAPLDGRRS